MAVSLVALELEAHLDSIRIKTVTQFRYVALWVSGAFSGAHCGVFPLTSSWVCTPMAGVSGGNDRCTERRSIKNQTEIPLK